VNIDLYVVGLNVIGLLFDVIALLTADGVGLG
jgi:hypothetical protein